MTFSQAFSPLTQALLKELSKEEIETQEEKISVNPVVAEVATWYEKLRNAMVYKEEEVILRAAIERILNRRLILGGNGETIASPLVRELVWARYFPDSSVPEALVDKIAQTIDLYLKLQLRVIQRHNFNRSMTYEWILQLLSCEVENILNPKNNKDLLSNFMFQVFKNKVIIPDDSEETKNAQVFVAVRRAFAKEDIALLRYHLFTQFYPKLTGQNLEKVAESFPEVIKKIDTQLKHPLKDRIYTYIKHQTPPFFVLEDLIKKYRGNLLEVFSNEENFKVQVLNTCSEKYKEIFNKVQRAVVRSVIFIFATKVLFALAIEGTFESFIYQQVNWYAIAINTLISPLLMIIASLFITTPAKDNSSRIYEMLSSVLHDQNPVLNRKLVIARKPKNAQPFLYFIFTLLWFIALGIGIWAIHLTLNLLHFNLISQGIFVFFMMVVSFLSYRINQTAKVYTVFQEKQGLGSILFDFFFMPFIFLGRHLTLGMSQINIFLFIFDFIIEAPFKGIFAFFEHWFLFLRHQRESLE